MVLVRLQFEGKVLAFLWSCFHFVIFVLIFYLLMQSLELDVDTTENVEVLRFQIFSVTEVDPSDQVVTGLGFGTLQVEFCCRLIFVQVCW